MCDIDYFKKFNDTYEHPAGDDCLKTVARIIQKNARRPSDVVVRYGGEEFAVILTDTNSNDAVTVARAIKKAIEQLQIPHTASLIKPIVSVSFGVATMIPKQHHGPDRIILLADKALYHSKNKGRDRIQALENS